MEIQHIQDRSRLAEYFSQNKSLHLYSLGDLDVFTWPRCSYYASESSGELRNVCLFYRGEGLPILLALGEIDHDFITRLCELFPSKFYAHLSPGLEEFFKSDYEITEYGGHLKMYLTKFEHLAGLATADTYQLTGGDLPEALELYQESYTDNAFDPRMLETGKYFGARQNGKLVSIAGVHVFSPRYRVAALGNITTHPDFRGLGIGRATTIRLCQELSEEVDLIGLNVKSDNFPAVALYQGLRFRISDNYGEFSLKKRD